MFTHIRAGRLLTHLVGLLLALSEFAHDSRISLVLLDRVALIMACCVLIDLLGVSRAVLRVFEGCISLTNPSRIHPDAVLGGGQQFDREFWLGGAWWP